MEQSAYNWNQKQELISEYESTYLAYHINHKKKPMSFEKWLKEYKGLYPYAISTSDGHDESWSHYNTKKEARKAFNQLKKVEDDIHLYKLNDAYEYDVIDSYWIDDEI
jgi:hypothetical protein